MQDFIFLMHNDGVRPATEPSGDPWEVYVETLQASGCFQGGSSMGGGVCVNKGGKPVEVTAHLAGYIRVSARDLTHARELLKGNPVLEAGGTVEIRELPKS